MNGRGRTGVLFVCTGNICRSPLAEGVFLAKARRRGVDGEFLVDSAGTGGWHAGERPDARMRAVAAHYGTRLEGHARQVTREDLRRFDHLICMDEGHHRWLLAEGAAEAKLQLLLDADASTPLRDVPDPYYGGPDGFEEVFHLVDSACEALLEALAAQRP